MKTLAIYQLKGGVGKTSTAVNLAAMAAAQGIPTLLWDLDAQGAATWILGGQPLESDRPKDWLTGRSPLGRLVQRTPYEGLDLLPAAQANRLLDILLRKVEPPRQALARLLKPFSESYALVVVDAPPSLSYLADNILCAADRILMPVVPGVLAWRTVEQVLAHAREIGVPARRFEAVYTLVDRRRGLHRDTVEDLDTRPPEDTPIPVAPVAIPYASSVEWMGLKRAPLAAYAGREDPALLAYAALWLDLQQRWFRRS